MAFTAAVMLLFLSGVAAYVAINRLVESQAWVNHSHEVEAAVGNIDSALVRAGRARWGYVISGNEDFLSDYEAAMPEIPAALQRLQQLTADNASQQSLCAHLEDVVSRRNALFDESIAARKKNGANDKTQVELDRASLPLMSEITFITGQMLEQERGLLLARSERSHRLFVETVLVLSVAFVLALLLFSVNYRFLVRELTKRERAERLAHQSEDALRRVTGRLLQLQDAERRKFSRDLHDSLGQYLTSVKMNLEIYSMQHKESLLEEAIHLLDQSIAETRTISHLLHPPLLDEAGLSSAARWYVEGFAQRSKIDVNLEVEDDVSRLPRPVALGLFRVLQESLTNIHRHSGSHKAEVSLVVNPREVTLKVRDYGRGIAPEVLKNFQSKGIYSGVGLAGMRERVRELSGELDVHRCNPGTEISATIPYVEKIVVEEESSVVH